MIASLRAMVHTRAVAKTNATWFGDQTIDGGRTATLAVFLRPYAFARLFWAGDCGEGFAPAGCPSSRFANPAFCPPTPFGDGTRASNLDGACHV